MSSLFWIEPGEVDELLGSAGWGSAEQGPAPPRDSQPSMSGDSTRTSSPEPPPTTGVTPSKADTPADFEFTTPPGASLEAAFEALLDAAAAATQARVLFVADEQGLVLATREASDALIAGGAALVGRWRDVRNDLALPGSGTLTLDLGAEGRLDLIPTTSQWGVVSLGVVRREPLTSALRNQLADALLHVLADREGNPA